MTERQIFRLSIRVVGLLLIGLGLPDAFGGLFVLTGLPVDPHYTALNRAAASGAYLLSAAALILAANQITRLIYGRDE